MHAAESGAEPVQTVAQLNVAQLHVRLAVVQFIQLLNGSGHFRLLGGNLVVLAVATVASTPLLRGMTLSVARRCPAAVVRLGLWGAQFALAGLSVSALVTDGYNPFLYFNF